MYQERAKSCYNLFVSPAGYIPSAEDQVPRQATSYSDASTFVAGICFLATMTFLCCCTFEHAYRAIAWQRFGQIRYNILTIRKISRFCLNDL
jgi:hypothetical protein